jgi:hypothetical protein
MEKSKRISLKASDVSQQKMVRVTIDADSTVGELIAGLLGRMDLPRNDTAGRPLQYQGFLPDTGRHMRPSESVGEALERDDRMVVLHPEIEAGGRR